ncbi:hypothetical protein HMPREF9371_0764 [Neisseria shayeganii 871]|uniref:Uncharacterized protein n=1 Tax=Neisseria shayeganii 871 TaxID=1032488 RepID=G4CGM5_9NEIS|nr:hypothetical protein HMPREF9371_0764 [Neisseria shayeganii 871]
MLPARLALYRTGLHPLRLERHLHLGFCQGFGQGLAAKWVRV